MYVMMASVAGVMLFNYANCLGSVPNMRDSFIVYK